MKLSFFLNWMGVVSTKWYDDYNIPYTLETRYSKLLGKEVTLKHYHKYYCCGRIDVSGHPDHPWNYEYSVGVMDGESWDAFGEWLDNLTLDYLPDSIDDIVEMFEKETGFKINWFEEEDSD